MVGQAECEQGGRVDGAMSQVLRVARTKHVLQKEHEEASRLAFFGVG